MKRKDNLFEQLNMEFMDFDLFIQEYRKLTELVSIIKKELESFPKGQIILRIKKGKYPQFYETSEEIRKIHPYGKYLKKGDSERVNLLLQKEYDEGLLKNLQEKADAIGRLIDAYEGHNLLQVENMMPEMKRDRICRAVPSADEFAKNWMNAHPGNQNTMPMSQNIVTERGENVRSKSEKIIADKLFYKGIPYQYEPTLKLKDGTLVCPDFAILNLKKRKTYYLEHFGMIDNVDYCKRMLEKIGIYEKNGYWFGENIVFTMESSQQSIDIRNLDGMIKHYFLS